MRKLLLRFSLSVVVLLLAGTVLLRAQGAANGLGYWSSGTSGGTVSGTLRFVDGTAAAPGLAMASNTDTGFWVFSGAPSAVRYSVDGTTRFSLGSTWSMGSGVNFDWSDSADPSAGSPDSGIRRLAAGLMGPPANTGWGMTTKAWISTAPTVTSAGTSPSVTGSNGTAAFRVNVGTGGTATTVVMAMPASTTGWNCFAENITATAANRAGQRVVLQSSTTTAVTVQNQTISTGAALAFTASDIVAFQCTGY